jgi:enoyl-CoA hydratase
VVLAASGERFFCTGGDLEDYQALTDRESAREVSLTMQQVLGRLRSLPCPVVCAVEGAAIGGGAELALACDVRIAGARATIAFPQTRLGVVPGWGGAGWLLEAVGRARAVELLATGRTLGADEAERAGLFTTVAPAGRAESAAVDLAANVAGSSRTALRMVKRVLDLGDDRDGVADVFADLWVGDEHRAAEAAWRARRG